MHKKYQIVDCHGDIPLDIFLRRQKGQKNVLDLFHYDRLKKAGIKIQVAALYVEERHKDFQSLEMACKQLSALLDDIEESKNFMLIKTKNDLEQVLSCEKIGIIIDMEGAEPVENGLELLRLFFRLGVRMLGLTWNNRNKLADGSYEAESKSGLTKYGKEVLKECESLGIIVDVSHMAESCIDDLLTTYKGVTIASHASSKTMHNVPRNLCDKQIADICSSGGLIGLPSYPYILSSERPTLDIAADHMIHLLSVAGEKSVGIGGDFLDFFKDLIEEGLLGNEWSLPENETTVGFKSATDIPAFLSKLKERGVSDDIIAGIAGENWIEFFRRVLPD